MKCYFCLEEREPSDEHVFPLAIGGALVCKRVCVDCNSELGNKVDGGLNNHPLIVLKREKHGLTGNSGKIPNFLEHLENSHIAGDENAKIRLTKNKRGEIVPYHIYRATETRIGDDTYLREISIDYSDKKNIPKIIERERKRNGMKKLSKEELDKEVSEILEKGPVTVDMPKISSSLKVDLSSFRRCMMKIAYELACMWLGDQYLDDPTADRLRKIIMGIDEESPENGIKIVFGTDGMLFPFLRGQEETHAAALSEINNSIIICLKIFNTISTAIVVTERADLYISNPLDKKARRCLVNNIKTNRYRNWSIVAEHIHCCFRRLCMQSVSPHAVLYLQRHCTS
ncbi:hypothetical protein GAY29_07210 [Azospirillum brasilense]|uniref:HNH endonuclease n=1 Tax=Azospirillum brasilense TaxID=192 RepID=UPI00190ADD43|nr:HNH endonuclease [Azospirillum brasilense]MBK3732901.1 hypothetical protein [Azospirillum brasilense]